MPAKAPIYLKPTNSKKGKKCRLRDILSPDMISPPLGDFRHTIHIGKGGERDAFGDMSFLHTEYNSLNSLVSEAFIRFFLETIGHYSLFIAQNERGERVFQREAFRKSVASKSIRRFLGVFMESQMFAGFIQDRELRKSRAKGRLSFPECHVSMNALFLPKKSAHFSL